jgi:hypothetical protein
MTAHETRRAARLRRPLRCEISIWPMSLVGHERRFCDVCGTSALPPILTVTADIFNRQLRATSGCEQSQQRSPLFDHLVGRGEQRRRHFKAERLRGA